MSDGPGRSLTSGDRLRRQCFTLNLEQGMQSDSETIPALRALKLDPRTRGWVYQLERAPTTGQLHLQGYVEFLEPMRLHALTKLAPGVHWAAAYSDRLKNVAYCTKQDTRVAGPWGSGPEFLGAPSAVPGHQGKRSDLDRAIDCVKAADYTIRVAAQEHPSVFVRHHAGLRALALQLQPPRKSAEFTTVVWLHGPTGIGKTSGALDWLARNRKTFYSWSPKGSNNWWDGYNGEKWVVIDELRPDNIRLGEMLRILQPHPYKVPVHGGQTELRARFFIITTNCALERMYPFERNGSVAPLIRRIDYTLGTEEIAELGALAHGPLRSAYIGKVLDKQFARALLSDGTGDGPDPGMGPDPMSAAAAGPTGLESDDDQQPPESEDEHEGPPTPDSQLSDDDKRRRLNGKGEDWEE